MNYTSIINPTGPTGETPETWVVKATTKSVMNVQKLFMGIIYLHHVSTRS